MGAGQPEASQKSGSHPPIPSPLTNATGSVFKRNNYGTMCVRVRDLDFRRRRRLSYATLRYVTGVASAITARR